MAVVGVGGGCEALWAGLEEGADFSELMLRKEQAVFCAAVRGSKLSYLLDQMDKVVPVCGSFCPGAVVREGRCGGPL